MSIISVQESISLTFDAAAPTNRSGAAGDPSRGDGAVNGTGQRAIDAPRTSAGAEDQTPNGPVGLTAMFQRLASDIEALLIEVQSGGASGPGTAPGGSADPVVASAGAANDVGSTNSADTSAGRATAGGSAVAADGSASGGPLGGSPSDPLLANLVTDLRILVADLIPGQTNNDPVVAAREDHAGNAAGQRLMRHHHRHHHHAEDVTPGDPASSATSSPTATPAVNLGPAVDRTAQNPDQRFAEALAGGIILAIESYARGPALATRPGQTA